LQFLAPEGHDNALRSLQSASSEYAAQQSRATPSVASQPAQKSKEGIGSFVEGAVKGDFGDNDSWSATAGQVALGFVPILGQIADARDTAAAFGKVLKGEEGAWLNLGASLVGWVPGVGDAAKAAIRGGKKAIDASAEVAQAAARKGGEVVDNAGGKGADAVADAAKGTEVATDATKGVKERTAVGEAAANTANPGKTIIVDSKGNALSGDWSTTKALTSSENAGAHWSKHGGEFPEFKNTSQYVDGAQNFVTNPPATVLTKTRPNGDVLLYDPVSNTFAVKNSAGAPRTMFRPTDGINYWNKQ
jgi:hypothetical protein